MIVHLSGARGWRGFARQERARLFARLACCGLGEEVWTRALGLGRHAKSQKGT